jgi:peptide/nickel transport system substrate-binding protein
MARWFSVFLALPLCLFMPAPVRAETQLLFLAEDVPAGLNFDGPAATINTSQTGFLNLLEPMIGYPYGGMNDDGVRLLDYSKFEGRLVESWEFDAKELSWTFHLRHGVKGCNGATFDADDVIYSFERAKSVSGKSAVGWFLPSVGSVKGFTRDVFAAGADKSLGDAVLKLDQYTVRIKQSAANALFLLVFTVYGLDPWDKETMQAHATPDDPWSHNYANTENAPGFGPYCLERWVKDDEFVLRANPDYYRGKPAIDRIVMKKVPQSSNRVITVRSGSAQLTQRLTPKEFDGLRRARGVKVAGVYGNETLFINVNFKTPLFQDLKLRQALAYGINYQQVIDTGYIGQARKWEGQIPSTFPGYHKPQAQYRYDPAKAQQLLAEAGFPAGAGLEKFGAELRLSYAAERESLLGPMATVIQTSLRDLGIPIVLDPLPQTQFSDRRSVKKDLPMALSDIDKAVGIDALYATKLYFVSPAAGGINNMANYSNPKLDELYAAALIEPDGDKRNRMTAEIQEILQNDLAWIPIVETKTQWAFSDKLQGITWHPDNSIRFFDLSLTQ